VHLSDGAGRGREFVEQYGWTFPVIDDEGWEHASRYGVAGHPAVVLVDEHGRVAGGFYGPGDAGLWDDLAAAR
jgi:hypothetical protein